MSMTRERELSGEGRLREAIRVVALNNLEWTLRQPEKVDKLWEHQLLMLWAVRGFLAAGHIAGYMSEPTGVGKSAVIIKLAEALGLRTLILSPTQQILDQTFEAAKQFAPQLQITNYDARGKDLSGQTVNTTYQSALSLLENNHEEDVKKCFDPNDIQLVLCDEAHLGLGEIRHTIYRRFPNALFIGLTATPHFTPIEGFIERGLVDPSEPWVGLFRNEIHQMPLEEAIEREILCNLDIYTIKTNITVPDITITPQPQIGEKDYSQKDLERYFTTKARNALAIGMITGKIPPDVRPTQEQEKTIQAIFEQIQGKRIAVFCVSINHAEELALQLKQRGITAAAVHSRIPSHVRTRILQAHKTGEIQVVLGVDILRIGWDSPKTEAGIYLRPTYSGIVKVQELGRILRPSEKSGKTKALAVEVVDTFTKRVQSPILIPNIFDPEYVLRGTQIGTIPGKTQAYKVKAEPKIAFYGMDVGSILETAHSQELLRKRLKSATLTETHQIIYDFLAEMQKQKPDVTTYELFQALSEQLPLRIPQEVYERSLQSITSLDSNIQNLGKRVLLWLHAKTLLEIVDSLFFEGVDPEEERDEMLHTALVAVQDKILRLQPGRKITAPSIHSSAKGAILDYLAKRDGVPIEIAQYPISRLLVQIIKKEIEAGEKLSTAKLNDFITDLQQETGCPRKRLESFVASLMAYAALNRQEDILEEGPYQKTEQKALEKDVDQVLSTLTNRERRVVESVFGLAGSSEMSLEETGKFFGVGKERVRQIRDRALRHLHHPKRSGLLKVYEDGPEQDLPIAWGGSIPNIGLKSPSVPAQVPPEEAQKAVVGRGLQLELKSTGDISLNIDHFNIEERAKKQLLDLGIVHIGNLFTIPTDELLTRWGENKTGLIQILKEVQEVLEKTYREAQGFEIPSDPRLLLHISDSYLVCMGEALTETIGPASTEEKEVMKLRLEELRKKPYFSRTIPTEEDVIKLGDSPAQRGACRKIFINAVWALEDLTYLLTGRF